MSGIYLYPIILAAGILQAFGPPMNGQLRLGLTNPWLASLVSFGIIVAAFVLMYAFMPLPGPSTDSVNKMPWWAPLGGVVGAFAVIAGLIWIDKVGAGPFAALTIGANLIASIVIDHFGLLKMPVHEMSLARIIGTLVMIIGMFLIVKF